MKIKILVENTETECCIAEHGLSLLVEFKGENYLVDTGASALYKENAEKMNIDLSKVKAAFLSHAHYDHSGGFAEFFDVNDSAKVYLQENAKRNTYFKVLGVIKKHIGIPNGILEKYSDRFEYVDGFKDFENGIYILPHSSEGILERAKHTHMFAMVDGKLVFDDFSHEQTLIFENEDDLVCINSCSHAGVDTIIEEIKRAFPEKRIKAFFGGFHMMGVTGADSCGYTKKEVQDVASKLAASSDATFYSGHCTGTVAFAWLKEILGERLQAMASGLEFEA